MSPGRCDSVELDDTIRVLIERGASPAPEGAAPGATLRPRSSCSPKVREAPPFCLVSVHLPACAHREDSMGTVPESLTVTHFLDDCDGAVVSHGHFRRSAFQSGGRHRAAAPTGQRGGAQQGGGVAHSDSSCWGRREPGSCKPTSTGPLKSAGLRPAF